MSTEHITQSAPAKPPRRNYCNLSDYYTPDGSPTASVGEDEHGPVIRTSPFGRVGPSFGITFELWTAWTNTVNAAINEHFASRIAANPS